MLIYLNASLDSPFVIGKGLLRQNTYDSNKKLYTFFLYTFFKETKEFFYSSSPLLSKNL